MDKSCSKRTLCDDNNCEICFNRSFASHPKAKYWSTKNESKPREVFISSNQKFIFDCDLCGHEFNILLNNITHQNSWCPYCVSKKLCEKKQCEMCLKKSFASHPKAKCWSNNNDVLPRNVFMSSHKKIIFDCDICNHEFTMKLDSIKKGRWCPYCNSNKLCNNEQCELCFNKSFAIHPKVKYWSNKNELSPRDATISSGLKCKFDCKCGHEFSIRIANVTNGQWCPYCSNPPQQLCCDEKCILCYEKSFASHPKVKYFCDDILPRNIFKSSGNKFLFKCNCGHYFKTSPAHIMRDSWCPYCSVPPKKLCDNDDCDACYQKSFASNVKSEFWSSENKITPRKVLKCSNKTFIFNCNVCNHNFHSNLNNIIHNCWCPYCSIPTKQLCDDTECDFCFKKSFASHLKSRYWSTKNEIMPRNVALFSNNKFYFMCNVCEHIFLISLNKINDGRWCPYCSYPPQKLCNNKCITCYEKSFASHPSSNLWSSKNKILPRDVFKHSSKKYFFKCEVCSHIFKTSLCYISRGTGCPMCINKTEKKLHDWLKKEFNNIVHQKKYDWCKNKYKLPYDFVLEYNSIIIELDGPQHFVQISNWANPNETHKRDLFKMKMANNNGYSVIRILQTDVWGDTIDWKKILKEYIDSNKGINNLFICNGNEYNDFMNPILGYNKLPAEVKHLINCGRVQVDNKEELENYPTGSLISYININNKFKSGGFFYRSSEDYFVYITPDYERKIRVRYNNIQSIWVGYVFSVKEDIVNIAQITQEKNKFPVEICDVIVYYAKNKTDKKRYMITQEFKVMMKWYEFFMEEDDNDFYE
jgi:very-short-patch-repair endonuclease